MHSPRCAYVEEFLPANGSGAMNRHTWLVNVGPGRLIDTGVIVHALRAETIGAAALDVTDPEPLPDGHRSGHCPTIASLFTSPTRHMRSIRGTPSFMRDTVRRRVAGEELRGRVDPELGY
jgi:D-3-phosphoglycerate dehydrogenase